MVEGVIMFGEDSLINKEAKDQENKIELKINFIIL